MYVWLYIVAVKPQIINLQAEKGRIEGDEKKEGAEENSQATRDRTTQRNGEAKVEEFYYKGSQLFSYIIVTFDPFTYSISFSFPL